MEADQIIPALQRVFNSLLEKPEDSLIDFVRAHRALRAHGPDTLPPHDMLLAELCTERGEGPQK